MYLNPNDPYLLPTGRPVIINFSGGRTSAYMLRRILDRYDGQLPPHVRVAFANTGKEKEETLQFVQECSDRWGVQITWLEYHYVPGAKGGMKE